MTRVLIWIYQTFLSPALHLLAGPGFGCRFVPSCSEFFIEAVEKKGVIRGSWLGMKRVCRCHPWGEAGYDPVPHDIGECQTHCKKEKGYH